jgi:hypothetical protein
LKDARFPDDACCRRRVISPRGRAVFGLFAVFGVLVFADMFAKMLRRASLGQSVGIVRPRVAA